MPPYPIDDVLDELRQAVLAGTSVIVQAPPGAGKTTRVPLALLDMMPMKGRIIMLEPRRIAAVAAARWMSRLLGEDVGGTVGYAIRFDRRVSASTRIEVVTEGVLTRRIQSDPALEDVAMVIFDEFHERSIHADFGLALCLDARKALREDLRLLVMSATIDCGPLEEVLESPHVIRSGGAAFPVEEVYGTGRDERPVTEQAVDAVKKALAETEGDILVFLPGAREIVGCCGRLRRWCAAGTNPPEIHPLYGDLPFEEQERAILPSARRRVILATNIAETSLTIQGVRAVIDSGLTRRLQHDPSTGMNRLITVTVSRASAEQRKGRAGRLGPGVCYRLYSRHTFEHLIPFAPPEILVADLSSVVLETALWGARVPLGLPWVDIPPEASWKAATVLLKELGALDTSGAPTPLGRAMARLPVHPRVARLLLRADELGCRALGTDLAALLTERDVVRRFGGEDGPAVRDPDIEVRLEHLRAWRKDHEKGAGNADPWALRAVDRTAGHILRLFKGRGGDRLCDRDVAGRLLLRAYPDRLGLKRDDGRGRYVLAQGRGVRLPSAGFLDESRFIVAANVDAGTGGEGTIHLAAAVTEQAVREELSEQVETVRRVEWSAKESRVVATVEERLSAVILSSKPFAPSDAEAVPLLWGAICSTPRLLAFGLEERQFQARVALMRRLFPEEGWPDLSEGSLFASSGEWLTPFLARLRSAGDLARLKVMPALTGMLSRQQARLLGEQAPSHLAVPSGRRVLLDYAAGDLPVLAVKLQELFGLADTPAIAGGRVKVLVHLLSPAGRPLQVTQDLRSFWDNGYQQVKREMKGRYPKHPWPEDPWNAVPTRRSKRGAG